MTHQAISLGLTAAPVVTIPARQARAFRVIDNRTSELTSWDTDLLPDALSGLNDLDIFSFNDVLPLAVTAGKTDPDDIPETPKNPVTRTGNLWVLGKHRIVCGDSTDQKTVERMQRAIHNHQGDVGGRSGEALAFEQAATWAVILASWRLNTLFTATYSLANYWSSRIHETIGKSRGTRSETGNQSHPAKVGRQPEPSDEPTFTGSP